MKNALMCWFAAMVAIALVTGCGMPLEEQPGQATAALGDYALAYKGYASTDFVGRNCTDPRDLGGSSLDWKWRVVGVPTDALPVLMKTDGEAVLGFWRASAITEVGDPALGQCDARGRWPLVFTPTYDPATDTNAWVLWTEPLHAGDPLPGSLFTVYFIDSQGVKTKAEHQF
jgi:hypothetical protein